MGFQVFVAATRHDWCELFLEAKVLSKLKFYPMSTDALDEVVPMKLDDLPGLGSAKCGILVQEPSFIAFTIATEPMIRTIHRNEGGIRYAIDQLQNHESFIFRPGGIWNDRNR